jgi:flagellar basal-body rod protein FlgC
VRVAGVVQTEAPPPRVYQPGHPSADAEGYVYMSNVNVVDEMVNMISASRSYENSVEVMNTSKELLLRTLSIGQ